MVGRDTCSKALTFSSLEGSAGVLIGQPFISILYNFLELYKTTSYSNPHKLVAA